MSGRFADGVVPTEPQLVLEYGVSRGVMRDALDLLRGEGLIDRQQGAGTFVVAPERVSHGIDVLRGLPEGIDRGAARISYQLLDLARMPAPQIVAERLGVRPGADVVFFERLTLLDGRPLTLRSSWIPLALGADVLRPGTRLGVSIYELLEGELGLVVGYTDQKIEATIADDVVGPVLKTAVGAPILLLERIVHLTDGRPAEFGYGRIRGDRLALTDVMRRQQTAQS